MSLFKKIFSSGTSNSKSETEKEVENPYEGLSIEEIFVLEFKKNGGKFLYCENINELEANFEDILIENDWFEKEALTYEPKLHPLLEKNNLIYDRITIPSFLITTCENLISEEGSILLCSNQIKLYKPHEIPSNIVIYARTSQIVKNKNIGMVEMRKRYANGYPSNITTIRYFEKTEDEDFLHYGSISKNVYLLLLEDL